MKTGRKQHFLFANRICSTAASRYRTTFPFQVEEVLFKILIRLGLKAKCVYLNIRLKMSILIIESLSNPCKLDREQKIEV